MSIHSRRAARQVLETLERYPNAGVPILHWFSGCRRELEMAVELGCWFTVGLPMLRSKKGRTLVSLMPRDRVLTETDGPFTQVNGSSAYPWHAALAIEELAAIWEIPGAQAGPMLRENLRSLVSRADLTD